MKEWLKRPAVKAVIIALFTIVISILLSLLGNWDTSQPDFLVKTISFSVCVVAYAFVLVFYSKNEVNDRRTIEELTKQVNTFESLMANIISICQTNTKEVNTCINEIIKNNTIDLNIWCFDKACQWICEHMYKSVCIIGNSKDFQISYVKRIDNGKKASLIAHANQSQNRPTIYKKERSFENTSGDNVYHDLELFARNKSDIEILDKTEIESNFGYLSKESRQKNKDKYNQYIAIPIFCVDSKMVGLLEIDCLYDARLGLNKEEVREVVNKYFIPYANIMLLFQKIEKALMAGVSNESEG